MVPHGSRVLDLGCGDGALLDHLISACNCSGFGVEIDGEGFHACIARGVPVMRGDIDDGLSDFDDDAFDIVVLSQTLQATHRPAFVLGEMLRVGRRAIVSFPNFGHLPVRRHLGLRGRMPVSDVLPYAWYETPNIHFCTITDFRELCDSLGLRVEALVPLDADGSRAAGAAARLPNLMAAGAVFLVARA
jgi:methionine biosynthesis protein MetW